VRRSTDAYFVRLDVQPQTGHTTPDGALAGRAGLGGPGGKRHSRRQRSSGTRVFVALLIVALGAWLFWASQRPGGISGTVDHWISHVRGDVANVTTDPDLATARNFYAAEYKQNKAYPEMSESDLTAAGIGIGINIDFCSEQAVVIQGADGGGTVSYLLVGGQDLGSVTGKYDCPDDITHPAPWK
jgi:hypothetical protein